MMLFDVFNRSSCVSADIKWDAPPPVHSMAWHDLRKGLISSDEKVKSVNLPPTIGRMMAEDARKRSFATAKKQIESRSQWTPPTHAQPLMSLLLPPISLFNPIKPVPNGEQNNGNSCRIMDEATILSVLTQVNTVARKIAEVMGTTVQARIERRKSDNAMCLFIYFEGFPWTIVGGGAIIEEEFVDKPPPPHKIYESWRIHMFQSLKAFLPPPLHSKMKRNIDKNVHMDWNIRTIESNDFGEIVKRVMALKENQSYKRLWETDPVDYDHRDKELVIMRAAIMRQIDTEVKSFWTYEKIGTHLKTNV